MNDTTEVKQLPKLERVKTQEQRNLEEKVKQFIICVSLWGFDNATGEYEEMSQALNESGE